MSSVLYYFMAMTIKGLWHIFKRSCSDFINDNVLKLSASLAFSTIFSLPGLLIITIWFANFFYGREVIEGTVYKQIGEFIAGVLTGAPADKRAEASITGLARVCQPEPL